MLRSTMVRVPTQDEICSQLTADLTEPQRQAVLHKQGPLLIVAGAGSGKTRVLTRRVACLIASGVPQRQILAITFTNKAAGEMKHRISAILPRPVRDFGKLDQPWPIICTFHSLCLRILKAYATRVGLPENFTIYDSGDQTKLIKEAIKLLDLSPTNFPPGAVHGKISNAKNQLLDPDAFAAAVGNDFFLRTVARIYPKYQKLLAGNNALDFDDLLLRTAFALRDHKEILAELQDRFRYILIDEYQDTNKAQYVLAHALAMKHRNICVVGDPDQSIYAWRGADIRNILDFETDYPDATVIRLEQNYRSTKTILQIASALIARNRLRKEKSLWTENDQGEKGLVLLCQDEHDEAAQVAAQLQSLHGKYNWNQMAIFYRMNSLSRVMEDALRRAGIPYQIARGVEFYNRKEIKDVLAYLRVINNPSDEVNLERIINVPTRGIGDASVKILQAHASQFGLTLWEALQDPAGLTQVSARASKAIGQFVAMISGWRGMVSSRNQAAGDDIFAPAPTAKAAAVRGLMEMVVVQSGLQAMIRKEDPNREDQAPNVDELISSAAEYDTEHPEGSLDDYLTRVSLVSDADHLKESGGAVTLMTLHAAKGLEFPVVAVIGLEEGCLPHSRAREDVAQLEEERRLFFVGITRAQERLIISKAHIRTLRGMRERTVASPFLAELPAEALTVIDRTGIPSEDDRYAGASPYGSGSPHASASPPSRAMFKTGQLVRHPQFGLGRVVEVIDMGSSVRLVVNFNSSGQKKLVQEYARLEAVG